MEKGVVELPFRLTFCRASVQSTKYSESNLFATSNRRSKMAKNTHLVGKT